MKKYLFIIIGIVVIQTVFTFFYKEAVYNKHLQDLDYHSKALSSPLWDFNIPGAHRSLELAVKYRYTTKIRLFDHEHEILMIESPTTRDSHLLLQRMGIIKSYTLSMPIYFESEYIGSIYAEYLDMTIYQDSLFLFILILISLVLILLLYLNKDRKVLEVRVHERTMDLEAEVNSRIKAESDLRVVLNSIGDGVIAINNTGEILLMNPVAEILTGLRFEENEELHINMMLPCSDANTLEEDCLSIDEILNEPIRDEKKILLERNNTKRILAFTSAPILDAKGHKQGVVIDLRDITEASNLLDELMHSQRVDAIGKLAGGIAHDFNNMIGAISGASELLGFKLKNDQESAEIIALISNAVRKASDLTGQLMSLYRKQKRVLKRVDVNELVQDVVQLLNKTAESGITISAEYENKDLIVLADKTSLESALMNLGINAIHALDGTGRLSFETAQVDAAALDCEPENIKAKKYAQIVVSDNGFGIPENILEKIFDPFYTTKDEGEGTGLGLTVVNRTIQELNGCIRVESRENIGTEFLVYIPLL